MKIIVFDMGFDNEKSFEMAERLKRLRESKGLSHEKLSKALLDQYGIKISSDSLINYEVANPCHSKACKNQGMRVEYLRCLADFYGVSADYLLGISSTKSPNPTIHSIVNGTGISEDVALLLMKLHNQDCRNLSILYNAFSSNHTDDHDNTPISQLLRPRAVLTLIGILLNCALSNEGLQDDYLSIHQSIDAFLAIQDQYHKEIGEHCVSYSGFDERVIPRSDYIRFKAHEICRVIEQEIVAHTAFSSSDDFWEVLANQREGD